MTFIRRLYRQAQAQTIELLVMYSKTQTPSLIDRTATQYQDVHQQESSLRMNPERKTPRNVHREAAGIGDNSSDRGYLDGQLLIAMPVMGDPRFERSVIYLCAHSSEGAMGIIVNRPAGSIDFPELLVQLDIIKETDQIKLPETAESMKVLKGGPVETGRGFVLHSSDFFIKDATLRIDDGICLTATVDILKAIAKGAGPKHAILALGYAGWAPGQLETEIQDNGWLHCDADPDLIFGGNIEEKYARALRKIGIDPGMLSNEAGHA
jgi:putative transcriptional regulator